MMFGGDSPMVIPSTFWYPHAQWGRRVGEYISHFDNQITVDLACCTSNDTMGDSTAGIVADEDKFYGDAKRYWSEIPATVEGMLGGFSHISSTDIAGSTKFLRQFLKVGKVRMKVSQYFLACGDL